MSRLKYLLYWTMMILYCIIAYKGRILTPSEWNLSTLLAAVLIVLIVVFSVVFDIEVNPFKIREHERRLKENSYIDKEILNSARPKTEDYKAKDNPVITRNIYKFRRQANNLTPEMNQLLDILQDKCDYTFVQTNEDIKNLLSQIVLNNNSHKYYNENCQVYGVQDKYSGIFLVLTYVVIPPRPYNDGPIEYYFHAWYKGLTWELVFEKCTYLTSPQIDNIRIYCPKELIEYKFFLKKITLQGIQLYLNKEKVLSWEQNQNYRKTGYPFL